MIISLYADGMTVREIAHHLESTLGTELSHETIPKIRGSGTNAPKSSAKPLSDGVR